MSEREQAKVELLTAQGAGPTAIGEILGRHHITVERHLANPDTQERVYNDKNKMAELYREKAHACITAIDDDKLAKSSALQLATAAGICTDKALMLTGDTPPIRVEILLAGVQAIKDQRADDARRRELPARTT